VAYYFKREAFPLIQAAFIQKFGPPANTTQDSVQNKLGAQFTRTTMTWKNGVSTVVLSEMSGNDLSRSQVVMVLDEIFREIQKLQDTKVTKAILADM
jgi:hypothetical protein